MHRYYYHPAIITIIAITTTIIITTTIAGIIIVAGIIGIAAIGGDASARRADNGDAKRRPLGVSGLALICRVRRGK